MRKKCRQKGVKHGEDAWFSYNQTSTLAYVDFDELLSIVLPLTRWWEKLRLEAPVDNRGTSLDDVDALLRAAPGTPERGLLEAAVSDPWGTTKPLEVDSEVAWLVRMAGIVYSVRGKQRHRNLRAGKLPGWGALVTGAKRVLNLRADGGQRPGSVHTIYLSRAARVGSYTSQRTVKADAARRVFDLRCDKLAWAVVDTGIDASHPAFAGDNGCRVVRAYDFERLGEIIRLGSSPDADDTQKLADRFGVKLPEARAMKRALKSGRFVDWDLLEPLLRVSDGPAASQPKHPHGTHVAGVLGGSAGPAVSPSETDPPRDVDAMYGMCPDIQLYDFRVLDQDGKGNEFTIVGALQFIRYLNAHRDTPLIHGVNISLWIPHDVRNYACGRTPICDECSRLVDSGVVVVTAAGNFGQSDADSPLTLEGVYEAISITDPGNTQSVITVGATHRSKPHAYGVSFFSSRGPTGDGRRKPDLVAPGEKILGPALGGGVARMDGTSQAAPHVSGAAPLLMARHPELIGDPARIKATLCDTATDLGRESYFQGHGLLDVLRALQSL